MEVTTKKEEAWRFSDLKNIVKNNIEELKFFNEKLSNVENEIKTIIYNNEMSRCESRL